MKNLSWKAIRETLARRAAPEPPTPSEAFWSAFEARARRLARQSPEAEIPAQPVLRWALAAACVLIAAGLTLSAFFAKTAPPESSEINSFDVVASHRAVVIMTDHEHNAAILWVVDVDEGGTNGDHT